MYEEYFDIVDENGVSTGNKALRSVAHTQGLWHRTVHVYVFRKKYKEIELLVHLRSKSKDLKPNTWDTRFGGHLKSGDSIEQALENELHEEIGLDVRNLPIIPGPIYKRNNFPNNEFTSVYFANFSGDINILKFTDNEVQEIKW